MPAPIGLVVKNGSKARLITSGVMPVPVSLTQSETYWPGGRSCSRAARASSQRLPVSIVRRPPSGMASRALMQRLRSAFSSWFGSARVLHRPLAVTTSRGIAGPTERRISSSMPVTSRFTLVGFGSSVWRREKASRRCVSAAARFEAPWAALM
ncbi:hypothetical protein AEGHOMDF_0740 [Methylobacterium soli]|nr:hypothetical protein AEGHOMDF_0740 [Methylobacterium soli]